jgi:hypothetical protein
VYLCAIGPFRVCMSSLANAFPLVLPNGPEIQRTSLASYQGKAHVPFACLGSFKAWASSFKIPQTPQTCLSHLCFHRVPLCLFSLTIFYLLTLISLEHLPSTCKALGLFPRTKKKKKPHTHNFLYSGFSYCINLCLLH